MDTANPLLHHHRIPREVVVYHNARELKIETLASDLRGKENEWAVRIREFIYDPLLVSNLVPGEHQGRKPVPSQPIRKVAEGWLEIGEQHHLGIRV